MAWFINHDQERTGEYRTYLLLITALVLLLADVVWEAYIKHETKDLWTFSGPIGVEFFREVGFAFFIAWVVAVTIERSSRKRQEIAANTMQLKIADNVFRGVYSNTLPRALIDHITNNTLNVKFIREYLNLDYELREENPTTGSGKSFVLVTTSVEYVVRNISMEKSSFRFDLGLDLHPDPQLNEFTKLESIEIQRIKKLPSEFGGKKNDNFGTIDYTHLFDIEAKETLHVKLRYVVVKNDVDTLIWSTIYPTLRLSLNLAMYAKGKKVIAHALYHKNFLQISGNGYEGLHRWTLDDVVLPHQGIVVFWGPRSDPDNKPITPLVEARQAATPPEKAAVKISGQPGSRSIWPMAGIWRRRSRWRLMKARGRPSSTTGETMS